MHNQLVDLLDLYDLEHASSMKHMFVIPYEPIPYKPGYGRVDTGLSSYKSEANKWRIILGNMMEDMPLFTQIEFLIVNLIFNEEPHTHNRKPCTIKNCIKYANKTFYPYLHFVEFVCEDILFTKDVKINRLIMKVATSDAPHVEITIIPRDI